MLKKQSKVAWYLKNFRSFNGGFSKIWPGQEPRWAPGQEAVRSCVDYETTSSPPFFIRDSKASETRARVKITHARKGHGEREK